MRIDNHGVHAETLEDAATLLEDPVFGAGMALMIGMLMRQQNLIEVKMDPAEYPLDGESQISFERDGDVFIARRHSKGALN
jgi:hypothetical protein